MEASLSCQKFSNLEKPPLLSLMKASHNSGVVMTGLCTTLSLPLLDRAFVFTAGRASPTTEQGREEKTSAPLQSNSIMTSHGGKRIQSSLWNGCATEGFRYRKLSCEFYRAWDLYSLHTLIIISPGYFDVFIFCSHCLEKIFFIITLAYVLGILTVAIWTHGVHQIAGQSYLKNAAVVSVHTKVTSSDSLCVDVIVYGHVSNVICHL